MNSIHVVDEAKGVMLSLRQMPILIKRDVCFQAVLPSRLDLIVNLKTGVEPATGILLRADELLE
jgi:hypothetical protein